METENGEDNHVGQTYVVLTNWESTKHALETAPANDVVPFNWDNAVLASAPRVHKPSSLDDVVSASPRGRAPPSPNGIIQRARNDVVST